MKIKIKDMTKTQLREYYRIKMKESRLRKREKLLSEKRLNPKEIVTIEKSRRFRLTLTNHRKWYKKNLKKD